MTENNGQRELIVEELAKAITDAHARRLGLPLEPDVEATASNGALRLRVGQRITVMTPGTAPLTGMDPSLPFRTCPVLESIEQKMTALAGMQLGVFELLSTSGLHDDDAKQVVDMLVVTAATLATLTKITKDDLVRTVRKAYDHCVEQAQVVTEKSRITLDPVQ